MAAFLPPRRAVAGASSLLLAAALAAGCGTTVRGTAVAGALTGGSGSSAAGGTAGGTGQAGAYGPAGTTAGAAGALTAAGAGPAGSSAAGGGGGAGGSGTGPAGSGAGGGPATVPVSGHVPGLTASTIKIGFITIDQQSAAETSAAFGAPPTNGGDPNAQVASIVKYFNAHGGIGGRHVVAVIRSRTTSGGSTSDGQAACDFFTKDQPVFAVVTNYRIDDTVEPCFAKRHTLFINDGLEPRSVLTRYAPYIWSPGLPSTEGGYAAYTDSLVARGFQKNAKIGIIADDTTDTHLDYSTVVAPRLKAGGAATPETYFVKQPQTDQDEGAWAAAIQGAVLKFKSDGINRVMFMAPGAGVPLIFMDNAQSQQYFPTYGVSSYDSPGFLLQKGAPATQLVGTIGAGFIEVTDVDANHGDPFPSGPGETQCLAAVKDAGTPASRGEAYSELYLCDGAFMLAQAAAGLGPRLSVEAWAAQADHLGSAFQAGYALPNGTFVAPGQYTGGTRYRFDAYQASCACFVYTSGNKPIPS